MKINEKILIVLSVFLVLIICSGAASASDENTQTLTAEYNDEIVNVGHTDEKLTLDMSSAGINDDSGLKELDNNASRQNLLSAGNEENLLGNSINVNGNTFEDIQNAVNSASAGDTIYLNSIYYTGSGSQISITKNLTIIGKNTILDAQNKSRIFNVNSPVTFKNITFVNGYSSAHGGAVYLSGAGVISDCSFANNTAVNYGGAVYLSGAGVISDCSFVNNSAAQGGAIYWLRGDNDIVSRCSFMNNTAVNDGGGAVFFWNVASGVISDCCFVNNSAFNQGGAIRWDGNNSTISNCSFVNNIAVDLGGGAIYRINGDNGIVSNCSFVNNKVKTLGGAIRWDNITNTTVFNCSFVNNTAMNAAGAIYEGVVDNGVVFNCSFVNNTATNVGGAIGWAKSKIGIVFNCSFVNNTAGTNGGAINWPNTNNNAIVFNCSFVNNTAGGNGGAINVNGLDCAVSNSSFLDNKVKSTNLIFDNYILTFQGRENYINAIYTNKDVFFDNVTFWNGNIVNTNQVTPVKSQNEAGFNITLEIYDATGKLVDNMTDMTNSSGQLAYDYTKLTDGTYTYKAYHTEDAYYTYIENTGSFTIKTYNIIICNGTYKQQTSVTLNATIKDNQTNQTINSSNAKLVFILPNGTEIEADYDGSNFYAEYTFNEAGNYSISARLEPTTFSSNNQDYSLNKVYNGTLRIYNPYCNITERVVPGNPGENTTIIVTVPSDVNGVITVIINNTEYSTVKVNDTSYVVNVTLPIGNYSAIAKLSHDSKYYDNQTNEVPFEIVKVDDYSIVVNVLPGKSDENTTVSVTVPKDATGNITVIVNGTEYPVVKVNDTTYIVNVTLPAGNYSVVGKLVNDSKYMDKVSDAVSFEVKKFDPSIKVEVIPGKSGENTTINVTVPEDVTGNITVIVNGTEYLVIKVNDTTYIVNVTLPAGNYSVVGKLVNDSKYMDKVSDTVPFEVKKVNPSIKVDVIPGKSGENTTVNVTVPVDVTANVTVIIDGTEYPVTPVNGAAIIELPLPAGDHTVVAYIGDDPKYDDTQSNIEEFSITKLCDLEIIVTVNPDHVNYGDAVEYIFTVSNHGPDKATGVNVNITISNDFEYISNNLTSNYNEIKNLLMSSSDKQSFDESTGIWNIGDLDNGETVKLAILLKAKYIGVKDVNGTVKGDDEESNVDNDNDSAPVTVTKVSDYPIDVKVTPGKTGENTTVNVTVPSDVTGNVTVVIDDVEYPVTPINGNIILNVPLPAGNHTVKVKISNDPKYEDNETEKVPFEVKKDDNHSNDGKVDSGKTTNKTKKVSTSSNIPKSEKQNKTTKNNSEKRAYAHSLAEYPTANPIFILLLVLFALAGINLRRF